MTHPRDYVLYGCDGCSGEGDNPHTCLCQAMRPKAPLVCNCNPFAVPNPSSWKEILILIPGELFEAGVL